jgi:N-methylhydantoinase A
MYRVGIDVGGTFTDAIAVDEQTGSVRQAKAPSTPGAEHEGVLAAVGALGIGWSEISTVHHGHTVGINAILTRSGAKTGLLCTQGLRDFLDFGRLSRPGGEDTYNASWVRPHQARPIVDRALRREIRERFAEDGRVLLPLDEQSVREAAQRLKAEGVESVAICFLHGYAHPEHERRAAEIVREVMPDAYLRTSSVFPVVRESERTTTVALDAYIGRGVHRYLDHLGRRLREAGYPGRVLIMQMNAGLATLDSAKESAIWQIQSGPTGGLAAAEFYAEALGRQNLITFDVGGTSTDVGVVRDGRASVTDEWTVEEGLTLVLPMIEVISIGAGGGSVVHADEVGALRVGPQSVGASPGPACYGRGGTLPALTDAYVALGLLEPSRFLGGKMPLDAARSIESLEPLASRLEMSIEQLAQGAYDIATANIAQTIRGITIYRGLDVREFALLAFGSAGPMQACAVAEELGMREVLIPLQPGAYSAFGVLSTNLRVDRASSPVARLDQMKVDDLEESFRALEAAVGEELAAQGAEPGDVVYERSINGMYLGQTWFTRVLLGPGPYGESALDEIREAFHRTHFDAYGYRAERYPIVVAQTSVSGMAKSRRMELPRLEPAAEQVDSAIVARVTATFAGRKRSGVPIYDRQRLGHGHRFEGPAIVDDHLATAVITPGAVATVDEHGVIRVTMSPSDG